ncbi:MAG: hypothetical protein ABI321_18620 [Polyangia bacterium]
MTLLLALDGAVLACLQRWPAHLVPHLLLYAVSGLVWIVLATRPRPAHLALVVLAAGLHVVALVQPPRHSDDVYRYLWDGAVQQHGESPYAYAPDAPQLEALRTPLWSRINNRPLPTIYPPGAQLAFVTAATLKTHPLRGWKLLVTLGDLATVLLLWRARGRGVALAWLSCPLVIVELCNDAHVEALGVALFTAALVTLPLRRTLGGALLGFASATKLLPIYLLLVLRDRRVLVSGLLAIALVYAPYASSGKKVVGSLGEYGRRWRSNDGLFGLVQAGCTEAVALTTGIRASTDRVELGRLGPLLTGRERPQAYPDELAGALARATVLLLFALVLLRRERSTRDLPIERRALLLAQAGMGAFLLLTPALHPWYALWLLPPVLLDDAPRSRPERLAWLWLVAAVPLGHVPLVAYLDHRPWHDPLWTRLLEHVPPLALLSAAWLSSTRRVV